MKNLTPRKIYKLKWIGAWAIILMMYLSTIAYLISTYGADSSALTTFEFIYITVMIGLAGAVPILIATSILIVILDEFLQWWRN